MTKCYDINDIIKYYSKYFIYADTDSIKIIVKETKDGKKTKKQTNNQ